METNNKLDNKNEAIKVKKDKSKKLYLLNEKSPFVLVEAIRNLITNIGFAIPQKENGAAKIVCISSAVSGEGKSTISANIAASSASAGQKTLLIDCDMRKPKIRYFFDIENEKGIVDFLAGQAQLEDILKKEVLTNLDVLPCFKAAPNPCALIKSPIFEKFLKDVSINYDLIVIDTPPLAVVNDCLVTAKYTDGIVLVAKQNYSDMKVLTQVVSDIEFSGNNLLGFVMNDFKLKDGKKYYYNKYGYKFGYKY